MVFSQSVQSKTRYVPLGTETDTNYEEPHLEQQSQRTSRPHITNHVRKVFLVLSYVFMGIIGFGTGVLYKSSYSSNGGHAELGKVAQRIPLPLLKKQFMNETSFLKEPPHGEGSGNISEPIWDSLIPNGLGYFKDGKLAPKTSIPTVFHQLHCLYIIRRAYYDDSSDLQEFDFGKDRDLHVAHCFDYIKQGLTCTIDTTVEPAVEKKGEFLGFGFDRQCQDFEALKDYVEKHRVFNASGFLAAGLDHGHAHIHSGER